MLPNWRSILKFAIQFSEPIPITAEMIYAEDLKKGDYIIAKKDLKDLSNTTVIMRGGHPYEVLFCYPNRGIMFKSDQGNWFVEFPKYLQDFITKVQKTEPEPEKQLSDFDVIPERIFEILFQHGELERKKIVSELVGEGFEAREVKNTIVFLQRQQYIQPNPRKLGTVNLTLKGRQTYKGTAEEHGE